MLQSAKKWGEFGRRSARLLKILRQRPELPEVDVEGVDGAQSARDTRPNAAPFGPAFRAAAVWVINENAIPTSGPAEGKLIVLETTGGKRDGKVDADALIRGAGWPAAIAPWRPKTSRANVRGSDGPNTPPPPSIYPQSPGRRPPAPGSSGKR